MQKFKQLTTDAAPQPPRSQITIEDITDDPVDEAPETQGLESSPPITPPPKAKAKFPIFGKKKVSSNKKSKKFLDDLPPPGGHQTKATGNVINIVNSSGIHWGPEINYHIGTFNKEDPQESTKPKGEIKMTQSITTLLNAEDEVPQEYMSYISKNLGSGWRYIFRSLGYTDGRIETMYESHKGLSANDVEEVIYQLLLDWKRNEDKSLGHLSNVLWTEDKRQLVKELAHKYKRKQAKEVDAKLKECL